jgi:hypothetical protein
LESVESNEQNAEERPQIGDSPDPDDVELEQDNAPKSENPDSEHEEGEEDNSQNSDSADTTEEDPTETANECPSGGWMITKATPNPDSPAPDTDNTDNNANQETGSDSGIEEDQDGETEQEGEMTVETDTDTPTKPPDRTELDTEPDSGQSTFGDFGNQDDPTEGDSGNEDSEIENSTEQTGGRGYPQKTTMRRAKTKQTRRQIVELIGAQVRNLAIPNRIQNLNKKANQKRMEDNNKIAHPNQPQAINQKRPNSKMVNRPV